MTKKCTLQCLIKLKEKLPKIPHFFLIFKPLWPVWKFSLAFKIVDVEPNQDHQRAQFRPQRKLQLPFLQLNLVLSFLKKKILTSSRCYRKTFLNLNFGVRFQKEKISLDISKDISSTAICCLIFFRGKFIKGFLWRKPVNVNTFIRILLYKTRHKLPNSTIYF